MNIPKHIIPANQFIAKYPNDVELAMKEYAKQFIAICWEKSRIGIGVSQPDGMKSQPEHILITPEIIEQYNNDWVFVSKPSIMQVEGYII